MKKQIIIALAIGVPVLLGIYLYRKNKTTKQRQRQTQRKAPIGEILTPRSTGNITTNVYGEQEVKNKLAGTQGGSAVNTGLFMAGGELKTF